MSTLKVDAIRHNSATSDAITTHSDGTASAKIIDVGGGPLSHRNKVHNGDMRISQRHGTTAHTPSSTSRNYELDRYFYWSNQASKASIQQVTDAPVGFYNSAKCTVVSAHTSASGHWFGFGTTIEAQDIYDLAQGTANAKSFTLSFYVKSSVTGTWAAAIRTKPGSPSRSYPFNYTISSANTWERKTITIPGSTDGTWLTGTSEGMNIWFDLGTGSSFHATANQWYSGNATGPSASPFIANAGATWLVTGVQLESGDTATSFEHRSVGEEIAHCQRYFQKIDYYCQTGNSGHRHMYGENIPFKCEMRAAPSLVDNSNYNSDTGSLQIISAGDYSTYVDGCSLQYASTSQVTVQGGNSSQYHRIRGRVHLSSEF